MTFTSSQVARDAVLVRRFGEPVRYTQIGEATITVDAVFDNPSRVSQVGQRAVAATDPSISVLKSEVGSKFGKGDIFEIGGAEYRVKRPGTDEGELASATLEEL